MALPLINRNIPSGPPPQDIRIWASNKLQKLLQTPDVEHVVAEILSLPGEDVERYIKELLGTNKNSTRFISDFLERRRKQMPHLERRVNAKVEEGVTVYRKKTDDDEPLFRVKPKTQPQAQTPHPAPTPTPTPAPAATSTTEPMPSSDKPQSTKKAKTKVIGRGKALLVPGQVLCNCMATEHALVGNCLTCGKIVCEQEGRTVCPFCGASLKHAPGYLKDAEAAIAHKNKLLDFDKTSAKRTVVYDDQADYFNADGNQWLSTEEKKKMKEKEEKLRQAKEEANKRKIKISFDFAGRKVTVNDSNLLDIVAVDALKNEEENTKGVYSNPSLSMPAPVFSAAHQPRQPAKPGAQPQTQPQQQGKKPDDKKKPADKNKPAQPAPSSKSRVQHEYFTIDEVAVEEMAQEENAQPSLFGLRACAETFTFAPWTLQQRKSLIDQGSIDSMNQYLYASTTDPCRCSVKWREPYTPAQLAEFGELIKYAASKGVDFNYAITPADFDATVAGDSTALTAKLKSIADQGCTHFSLMLDELPQAPNANEAKTFLTLANTHANIANVLIKSLASLPDSNKFKWFLLPAFHYADFSEDPEQRQRFAKELNYLKELHQNLDSGYTMYFTGPAYYNRIITASFMDNMEQFFNSKKKDKSRNQPPLPKRKFALYDNFPVITRNPSVLFFQPYDGRDPELYHYVAGITVKLLPQPTCALVPLFTALHFLKAPTSYNPTPSFKLGLLSVVHDDRIAEDLYLLITEVAPESEQLGDKQLASLKTKKLSSKMFLNNNIKQRVARIRSAPINPKLKQELEPFFDMLDNYADVNILQVELNEVQERKKELGAEYPKKLGDVKDRLAAAQKKLDQFLRPAL